MQVSLQYLYYLDQVRIWRNIVDTLETRLFSNLNIGSIDRPFHQPPLQ
jgi:hypothetical protein